MLDLVRDPGGLGSFLKFGKFLRFWPLGIILGQF